jgi:hypothetical protein
MMLLIKKESTAEEIQKAFSYKYPHLVIRFYKEVYTAHEHKTNLSEIKGLLGDKYPEKDEYVLIDIGGKRRVGQLEGDLASAGIQAKIFRKSGKVSIEIVLTRGWTLERQDEEAMLLEKLMVGQ